ncbi:hypothetical protein Fot_55165 [Forsythia ovata]|uniref:Uncharacterized protein n=1 Tax=Forsythia ovata TaxID=205694 RepID=A0ABD1P5J3_9LAMI
MNTQEKKDLRNKRRRELYAQRKIEPKKKVTRLQARQPDFVAELARQPRLVAEPPRQPKVVAEVHRQPPLAVELGRQPPFVGLRELATTMQPWQPHLIAKVATLVTKDVSNAPISNNNFSSIK